MFNHGTDVAGAVTAVLAGVFAGGFIAGVCMLYFALERYDQRGLLVGRCVSELGELLADDRTAHEVREWCEAIVDSRGEWK